MKRLHYGHCILGVGIALVLLLALGVSASTLGFLAVVALCPLMMIMMMRFMMGDSHKSDSSDQPTDRVG